MSGLTEARRHELKTWPDAFQAMSDGRKLFEVRRNDRDYQVGDTLFLREWSPATERYSGRTIEARVPYILHGPAFGLPVGMCVMSTEIMRIESGRALATAPTNTGEERT